MMKTGIVLLLVVLLACGSAAAAQTSIGLEYALEETVGMSLKTSTGDDSAKVLGIAWSFREPKMARFHFDSLTYVSQSRYYGVGLGVGYTQSEGIGNARIRFSIGFEKSIPMSPITLFFELVPLLELMPASAVNVSFTVGVRF